MKKDTIEELFIKLKDTIDFEEPNDGHHLRFLNKLNESKGVTTVRHRNTRSWIQIASMAAAVTLLLTFGFFQLNTSSTIDEKVAKISPEASKTQFYFANLIEEQVKDLNSEKSPETERIINDTMLQLKKLEVNYTEMEQDLINGGNGKLILSAMITNFQTRIELLNEVMIQIENIKTIKNTNDANYII